MEFVDIDLYSKKCGIYKIVNTANNRAYVGQTTRQFIKRYWEHGRNLRNGTHVNKNLQRDWDVYGEDSFYFEVLESFEEASLDILNEAEVRHIEKFKDEGLSYNVNDGGDRISVDAGNKIAKSLTGKKHSEETKRKMSETRRGKHVNRSDYRVTLEEVRAIKTMLVSGIKPADAARELNVDYKAVNMILSNNCWEDVCVDGWDEFRSSRKTWTRLSKEDHKEIYRLYSEEGVTKQELIDMYGKSRHMINKIIKKFKEQEQKEQEEHYKTIQCEAS